MELVLFQAARFTGYPTLLINFNLGKIFAGVASGGSRIMIRLHAPNAESNIFCPLPRPRRVSARRGNFLS